MHPELIKAISSASLLPEDLIAKTLMPAKQRSHGDISFPCFVIAKNLQVDPAKAAKDLAAKIVLPENIERFEILGPYINFFRKRSSFVSEVLNANKEGSEQLNIRQKRLEQTVIIEYSSPNIAKPFHIGHLRTTLIGHSLDRIYRFLGYKVVSINHLGDWGTQFGFVFAGCQLWGRPEKATIFELVDIYIRATTLRKQQDQAEVPAEHKDKPEVNELAKEYFRKLESGDKEALEFWQWCLDISLDYLKKLYNRLGVHFDFYSGESFYRDKLNAVESDLRKSGALVDSEGALGVDLGKQLGFVRVFSEDGRSLYVTRDLATADYRHKTFNPEKVLYVVGAPQSLYFKQLIAILKKINHPIADKMVHVSYGNVPGISTRASKGSEDRIWLDALLNEAHERAAEAYQSLAEKRPAQVDQEVVAEAVGLGAVFFNYLSRTNIKEFHFNWEEALNFQGDTGPYIQYALARLNSIEEKAKEQGLVAAQSFDPEQLVDDEAFRIITILSQFSETLEKAAADYEPYHVANYILELARAVSEGYSKLRVIGQEKSLAEARLALFDATKKVLKTGLNLLGVPAIDRM